MTTPFIAAYLVAAIALSPQSQEVTFSETIAPILFNNCVTCHRPGEAAPFSLISYEDVRKRATTIAAVTKSRYMPPWHAEHGYGVFKDERRLTDAEITAIAEWVKQGMPQGDPERTPQPPSFPEGWQLGKPDLILEMPASFAVPASGPDIYRNFTIPTALLEDKWVRAVEFRPSSRKVVHHALFAYDSGGAARKLEGLDGQPGAKSGMAPITIGGAGKTGSLGGWAVGVTAFFLPDGMAFALPKGSDVVLQMHFHPSGKAETEKSVIGLHFADRPPEKDLFGVELPALFGFGAGINIPAGKGDYTIEDSLILPIEVEVFAVAPHAHYVAKEMKATAILPDGSREPILWIRDWDFNWQDPYIYKAPIVLPKGTQIEVRLTYDNSSANPRNPNSPPKSILWGEQTFDEMASINLLMTPKRKEEGYLLQQLLSDRQRSAIQRGVQDGTLNRMLELRAN